ncbi:MAG: EAL domain-containing protein [Acidimicrobiales bacterium]
MQGGHGPTNEGDEGGVLLLEPALRRRTEVIELRHTDDEVGRLIEERVAAFDRAGAAILVHAPDGSILQMNFRSREVLGVDWPQDGLGLPGGWTVVDDRGEDLPYDLLPRRQALASGTAVHGVPLGIRGPAGDIRWMLGSAVPVATDEGEVVAVVTSLVDRTGQVLHDPHLDGRGVADRREQAILACDRDGQVTYLNAHAEQLYGCTSAEAQGREVAEVVTWAAPADQVRSLTIGGTELPAWSGDMWVRRQDGSCTPVHLSITPVELADGASTTLAIAVDVSERRAALDALIRESYHDELTGLANRRLFLETVAQQLGVRVGGEAPIAVVLIDLDDLRLVNDGFGHEVGDAVIAACAAALRDAAHATDAVARLDAGTFAVCCAHLTPYGDAASYVERLRSALAQPIEVHGTRIQVRTSAGIAMCVEGDSAAAVLERADLALSRAKQEGADRSWVYDEALRIRARRDLELEGHIRQVIERGEVTLGYQPIVRIDDGTVSSAEALLRLADDEGNPLSALEVVTVAERRGLIGDLGLLILETACRAAAGWQAEMPERSIGVSVNVSACQLEDPELPAKVREVLTRTGLEPSRLTLEMTESVLMGDSAWSAHQLGRLKMGGVRLSADDFGTGYSSLAYLKRFPLDVIKADLSFVAGLPDSPEDAAVVSAIVGVADAMGLEVVGEGVEHRHQATSLAGLGCRYGQGRLWSWAVPGDEFASTVGRIERVAARAARAGDVPGRRAEGAAAPDDLPALARGAHTAVVAGADTALRTLAHEVRSPLTVVLTGAQMLQEDHPELGPELDMVVRAGRRIDEVIAGLEDVAALDRGDLEIHGGPFDLLEVAQQVGLEVALARGAVVTVEPLLIGSALTDGDPHRIQQVLVNLVTNAVKYAGPTLPVVVLVGRRARWVEAQVIDQGPGIGQDQVGLVFRKYGRLDRTRSGTGLGLYLARGIARAHGGDVTYRARRDRSGSVFTLRLPAHRDEPSK